MSENLYGRDHLMVIAAFRYCLGRMSYIVSDCCDWLIEHWESFPENVRNIIKRELEEAFRQDDSDREHNATYKTLGWECDRKQWERVRRLWQ